MYTKPSENCHILQEHRHFSKPQVKRLCFTPPPFNQCI
uniref:Uncharacterized protein n=1 Tax=Arundo donax TaxID=35708 RepID=A0A0A9BXX2_ARUDO